MAIFSGMAESEGITLIEKLGSIEAAEIRKALEESGWVKAKAARRLGITERMIGYKIKKYGIRMGGERAD